MVQGVAGDAGDQGLRARGLATGNDSIYVNPAGLAMAKIYSIELGYLDDLLGSDRRFNASIVDSQAGPVAGGFAYTYTKRAPDDWKVHPVPERHVNMDRMPPDDVNLKRVIRSMPPLIRGYLRLGGEFGDGAVVDYEFNTTDVCVVVAMSQVTDKYLKHYLRDTELGDKRRDRDADD